ncbi:SRPBCC family protein [Marinomonas sp. PE14-40]|uniref:SRPBCC family protein n=1 Tax=Marinomonas sp. PE14-40 TaxID=3060621 RepID=UPI003F67923E
MIIYKSITINQPASQVWKIVGEEFEHAHIWMSFVAHSFALENKKADVSAPSSAPVAGRVCRFNDKENGGYAEEEITVYDPATRTIEFNVIPKNMPAILPIRTNKVRIHVKEIKQNRSEVQWTSAPEIKSFGLILSPLLKLGLGKSFQDILKELKTYSENRQFKLNDQVQPSSSAA